MGGEGDLTPGSDSLDHDRLEQFLWWMCERQRIWHRRDHGKDFPWTSDEILQEYFFCRVHRELDKTTQYYLREIGDNDRARPYTSDYDVDDLLLNTVVFRFFNRISTFEYLGRVTPAHEYDIDRTVQRLQARHKDTGVFSSAYRVSTQDWAGADTKFENIMYGVIRDDVLADLNTYRAEITRARSLREVHNVLTTIRGVGDFLAYEIATDLNYTVLPYSENDFVNVGPGAEKALEMIFGDSSQANIHWFVGRAQENLFEEHDLDFRYWDMKPLLTARDFEHSLCEWRKYVEIDEEGADKRKFSPDPHNHPDQNTFGDFV